MTCGNCGTPTEDGFVCPRCLGRIRGNLDAILADMALMPAEAVERGIDSWPAVWAGPVANPILHRWRQVTSAQHGLYAEEPDDSDPYTALAWRERMIREDLGHDRAVLCSETLAGTCGYLTDVLTDLARDEAQTLVLADLLEVTSRLRGRLDAALRDQRGPERGAPCPECEPPAPRLTKRWSHWCEDADCERIHDATGALDRWVCPAEEEHWWSEADYRLRVADEYLANAVVLTASELEREYGVPPTKLRKWANGWVNGSGVRFAACVEKRGRDSSGRQLYVVDGVLAAMDAERVVLP